MSNEGLAHNLGANSGDVCQAQVNKIVNNQVNLGGMATPPYPLVGVSETCETCGR